MKTEKDSPALQFLQLAWDAIPRRSWRNRNGAMHSALHTAITSGMEFESDDIKEIYERFNAGYWIGEGHAGLYSLACEASSGSNIPAAIAWEKWYGREPYLWAEKTRSATRLHIDSQFTWQDNLVTVTSFGDGFLTACTYKDEGDRKTQIGDAAHFDGMRREILNLTRSDLGIFIHLSPTKAAGDGYQRRTPERRFKVPYAELTAVRKDYDSRRRAIEKELLACADLDALAASWERVGAPAVSGRAFRHFDVEMIREAHEKAKTGIEEGMTDSQRREQKEKCDLATAERLARWQSGEDRGEFFSEVRLRRKGDWVETSTGQRATVAGCRSALAFILKNRKGWSANGATFSLDAFPLNNIDAFGAHVGCTLIPWREIDRIAPLLK